jgi:hypothetical protein
MMAMRPAGTGLLLLAMTAALWTAGCNSKTDACTEFMDAAGPLLSAVAVPPSPPSGEAAVAWARATAKQYEQIAQEAEKSSGRTSDYSVKSALQSERVAATTVANQLYKLADAATAVEPAKVLEIKSELSNAARSEKEAADMLQQACAQ